VGADRTKDLAVVQISAPKVLVKLHDNWSSLFVGLIHNFAVSSGTNSAKDVAVLHITAPKVPLEDSTLMLVALALRAPFPRMHGCGTCALVAGMASPLSQGRQAL
jgi:hypothetical protein